MDSIIKLYLRIILPNIIQNVKKTLDKRNVNDLPAKRSMFGLWKSEQHSAVTGVKIKP